MGGRRRSGCGDVGKWAVCIYPHFHSRVSDKLLTNLLILVSHFPWHIPIRRHRWPVEVYYEEGKAEGLDKYQLRDFEGIQRHVAFVAVVYCSDSLVKAMGFSPRLLVYCGLWTRENIEKVATQYMIWEYTLFG